MKRAEKVKDVVEIRPFTHLHDFSADAGLTLASYHFTDITSDLMGKWIERIADVRPGRGDALALAGSRGVGKSHFLAVLAALTTRSELRSQIKDPHVLSRSDLLKKRQISNVFIRRGTGPTLLAELKTAVQEVFKLHSSDLNDSLYDVLSRALELSGDAPLVIFVDTAVGRMRRVDRDDGALLSEIAEAARNLGIFVGVTLDDDISGADGANSSIARTFQIDFLDQEHLHRIVERHIFVKESSVTPLLREIYAYYRKVLPGFNWSEQRFISLYPLHPATIEIAPLIRLFIQDFALLGFASEAGVRILGRPADSLIGLDEMFGSVEARLRKSPDLKTAFSNFDRLEQEVVNKTPVQFRLQAKLCLKGLLLLSLDGGGATAAAISAAMTIFDPENPELGPKNVEDLLEQFHQVSPDAITVTNDQATGTRYGINIGLNEGLDEAIADLRVSLTENDLWDVLLRHLSERFPEIQAGEADNRWSTHCTIEWRGGLRRGDVTWFGGGASANKASRNDLDWHMTVRPADAEIDQNISDSLDHFIWRIAPLTIEDRETIGRYSILVNNPSIREKFSDGLATSLDLLSLAIEKICQRVFFEAAFIQFQDQQMPMAFELASTHNLSHLFAETISEIFDQRYPNHPSFTRQLGLKEVSSLISDFFAGSNASNPQVQELAATFAEPLGLTIPGTEALIPAPASNLEKQPFISDAIQSDASTETILLRSLYSKFLSPPYGLTREAQQLILAWLVSQREFEFVTETGNRINHRSLDLHVIWDDVIGIARPLGVKVGSTQLISWARTLTSLPDLNSISTKEDRDKIRDELEAWVSSWTTGQTLENYDRLPDESLNASSWRNAVAVKKSLGAVSNYIRSFLAGEIELDVCLESIAELFLGLESEFEKKKKDLDRLADFTQRAISIREISDYLVLADHSDNSDIETSRRILLNAISWRTDDDHSPTEEMARAWTDFQGRYSAHYERLHKQVFEESDARGYIKELSERNDWPEFGADSILSSSDALQEKTLQIRSLLKEYNYTACQNDPYSRLATMPFCVCGFRLSVLQRLSEIPDRISAFLDGTEVVADTSSISSTPSDRIIRDSMAVLRSQPPSA